jgi:hypothetical protein
VKCENEQLEQCSRVYKKESAVVSEIGAALTKIAEALKRARSADWSTKPTTGALTWINQPRSMKYFIQHLNMALALLGRQQTIDNDKAQQTQAETLKSTECLARLILGEQDQCQRNNSQIIAKFYEIGQKDIALQLADDFEVNIFISMLISLFPGLHYADPSLTCRAHRRGTSCLFGSAEGEVQGAQFRHLSL